MMMSSRQKRSIARPMRSSRRRLNSQRRFFGSEFRKSSRTAVSGGACVSVSDKLEALKSLIPAAAAHNGEITKADQLFQETADYIVLLKTQVSILQRLVDFYGSSSSSTTSQNPNAV